MLCLLPSVLLITSMTYIYQTLPMAQSASASLQSDQNFCCPHDSIMGTRLAIKETLTAHFTHHWYSCWSVSSLIEEYKENIRGHHKLLVPWKLALYYMCMLFLCTQLMFKLICIFTGRGTLKAGFLWRRLKWFLLRNIKIICMSQSHLEFFDIFPVLWKKMSSGFPKF